VKLADERIVFINSKVDQNRAFNKARVVVKLKKNQEDVKEHNKKLNDILHKESQKVIEEEKQKRAQQLQKD